MNVSQPRPIWVDFSKGGVTLDGGRFVILAALGTLRDLFIDGRRLAEGQDIVVYTDDVSDSGEACYLLARGTVHYDTGRREWWAELGQVACTGELLDESDAWISEVDLDAISRRAALYEQRLGIGQVAFDVEEAGHVVRRGDP
jgi:hypothetical protein